MIWGYHYFWKHPAVCKLLVLFAFAAFGKYVIFLLTSSSRVSKSVSFSLLQHEAIATEKFEVGFPWCFIQHPALTVGYRKKILPSHGWWADGRCFNALQRSLEQRPQRTRQQSKVSWNCLPSLKLTASLHLKMDGWNTIVSFWDGLYSGANC